MEELLRRAKALDLTVVWHDLGRRNGEILSGGLVLLNPHRCEWMQRVTLAHEMGHWWHGHDWRGRHNRERDERQADTYAAEVLISPADYALAESVVGEHPGAIAKELAVTRRLVELWRVSWVTRLAVR